METEIAIKKHFAPSVDIQARENFLKSFDTQPRKIDKAQGYETVPISALETELDQTYMGLWKTDNFTHQVIANEIVGSIQIHVYDPSIKAWITRTGCASVMIRQTKDAQITDIGAKIKNGLVMDFPKLATMCLKAAAKTLGKKFGRDLNRKFEDSYNPVYSDEIALAAIIESVVPKINECKDLRALGALWVEYPDLQENQRFIKLFNQHKMKLQYAAR